MSGFVWKEVNPYGAIVGRPKTLWNADKIVDVLAIKHTAIAASQYGGVWVINRVRTPDGDVFDHPAVCISDGWLDSDMVALAFGPDNDKQVYALTAGRSVIYAIDLEILDDAVVEAVGWRQIPLPVGLTNVQSIVVQSSPRRVILGMSGRVVWSPIPELWTQWTDYVWTDAVGFPPRHFVYLAPGPEGTVIASAGSGSVASPGTGPNGIYVGDWTTTPSESLVFSLSDAEVTSGLGHTTLSSSKTQPSYAYAANWDADASSLRGILRTVDGGKTWRRVNYPPGYSFDDPSYMRILAVHPSNPDVVLLGGQSEPFLLRDGGTTWVLLTAAPFQGGVDNIGFFSPTTEDEWGLFLARDGGVTKINDAAGPNYLYDTRYNSRLANLAFGSRKGGPQAFSSSASSVHKGLYAGTGFYLGDLVSLSSPTASPAASQPWTSVDTLATFAQGFGGITRFIASGHLLVVAHNRTQGTNAVRAVTWDVGTNGPAGGDADGIVIPLDNGTPGGSRDGLISPVVIEAVPSPAVANDRGEVLYAVAAVFDGSPSTIFGLFGAAETGAGLHWTTLIGFGTFNISAMAPSDSGRTLVLGTSRGELLSMDLPSFASWTFVMPRTGPLATDTYPIKQIVFGTRVNPIVDGDTNGDAPKKSLGLLYALNTVGALLRYDGTAWSEVPTHANFRSLAVDRTAVLPPGFPGAVPTLMAATSSRVFESVDRGDTWTDVTGTGLPAGVVLGQLLFTAHPPTTPGGRRSKYLSITTSGRGIWRATIDNDLPPLGGFKPPSKVVDIIVGVIQDGGGWVFPRGGGGPVPIDPWGPLVAGAAAGVGLAHSIPGALGRLRTLEAAQVLVGGARAALAGVGAGKRGIVDAEGSQSLGVQHPEKKKEKEKEVSLEHVFGIIDKFRSEQPDDSDDQNPALELLVGLLAAELAGRSGGTAGEKAAREALTFVAQRAEELAAKNPGGKEEDGKEDSC